MSFDSLITTTTDGVISLQSMLICMGAAILLGIIAAVVYMQTAERYTKNFVVTVALLPALVQVVIVMTNGNLGSAVAVLGAFSLVRFRSVPGTSREILAIFFAMAIGLACGMGQVVYALLITLLVSAVFVLLLKMNFGSSGENDKVLKVTIPEDLDYSSIFDDIFKKYTKAAKLMKVRTVNLGSMYELDYNVTLKSEDLEKQMIDDIRVRNGNLTIVCARHADAQEAL